jgi:hypothetical protein
MATPPTTLIITYTGGTGSPYTYVLPTPFVGVPVDYSLAVRNILLAGGFWSTNASGVQAFVPWSQITSITAQ